MYMYWVASFTECRFVVLWRASVPVRSAGVSEGAHVHLKKRP